MGAGQSMAIKQASMSELADDITPEEAEAHDVRRLRWILRVRFEIFSCSGTDVLHAIKSSSSSPCPSFGSCRAASGSINRLATRLPRLCYWLRTHWWNVPHCCVVCIPRNAALSFFFLLYCVANNPGSCEEWYLGDERDGVRHGHGAAFYTSGDVYLGQWHRGEWHGRGTLTHMSGAKYTGYFEKGEKHGTGDFVDVDGVRFRGEYRQGVRYGSGYLTSPNGAQFEGWFRDGTAHGDGMLTWPDGGKFIGKYVMGKEHGRGAILDPLGCKVCDVECAGGVLVGGRTVCPGSLGGGKGPKCRGGSQSCGFCLQTALDLELSIANEDPDALQALSMSGGGEDAQAGGSGGGARGVQSMSSGSHSSWGGGAPPPPPQHECVVRVKPRPYSPSDDVRPRRVAMPPTGAAGRVGGGGGGGGGDMLKR
ncbi:unnamed protein product [Ectocarpus sp. 4 AP-2014]